MTDPELIGMNKLYAFYKKHTVKLKKNATKEERLKVHYRYLVDRSTFVRVVKDFNKELARMIIEDAIEFKIDLSFLNTFQTCCFCAVIILFIIIANPGSIKFN